MRTVRGSKATVGVFIRYSVSRAQRLDGHTLCCLGHLAWISGVLDSPELKLASWFEQRSGNVSCRWTQGRLTVQLKLTQ